MAQETLHGVIVPIITPVDAEDRVDEPALRKLVRAQIDGGVHGFFVGGSTGEGPLLTLTEYTRLMQITFDETKGRVALLGGVMDTATRKVTEKIKILTQIGYSYYVVAPPFYVGLKLVDEYLRLFGACKEQDGGMELVMYNIPSLAHSVIPVEAMLEAAKRGWSRYCKDSAGDMPYFRRLMTEGAPLGLLSFMGDEASMYEALKLGAAGIIPGSANFEPEPFVGAYNAAKAGREDDLKKCFQRMMDIRQHLVFAGPCWVAGIKYGAAVRGFGSGQPMSPLQPLTDAEKRKVEEFAKQPSGIHQPA